MTAPMTVAGAAARLASHTGRPVRTGLSCGARPCQAGLGLAELLVATAVGALLLLMGTLMLVSANTAYTAQADSAAIDDGGRFALDLVARSLRQAGYPDSDSATAADSANAAPAITGLDARSLPRNTAALEGAGADAVNGSDVLALRFSGASGGMVDCAGFGVDAGEEGWSIFHVGRNAAGEGELRCKYRGGGGWSSDGIVSGVESFQVLYGLDSDTPPDGVPNEFVSASVVEARDAELVLEGADAAARERDLQRRTHWKQVAAVRIALLLHGEPGGTVRKGVVHDLFGPAYSARFGGADVGVRIEEAVLAQPLRQRERRLFGATIVLRNAAGKLP